LDANHRADPRAVRPGSGGRAGQPQRGGRRARLRAAPGHTAGAGRDERLEIGDWRSAPSCHLVTLSSCHPVPWSQHKGENLMKSALIVWGGWQGHQPESSARLFAGILREAGYQVELSDTLDAYLNAEKLQSFSLIVPTWTMGTIKPEQERGLLDAVRSGVGVAGWHGTMGDSFRNNTEYQFMVGGQWVAHPGNI